MGKDEIIFVAGGTGMVGAAIIRKLLASDYTSIVSNYHNRKPSSGPSPSVTFLPLDLTRQRETEQFFESARPQHVYLAAARVGGILANDTYPAQFIYDNIMIAGNVINAAHKFGVKKLLNLGSSCIYPKFAPQPMKEEHLLTGALEPTNEAYAIAKIAAIKLCRYFNEQYGANFLSVMPANLYGSHDNFNLETAHVLPAFIRKFHLAKLLRAGDSRALRADIQRCALGFGLDEKIRFTDDSSIVSVLESVGITREHVMLWGSGEPFREFLHVDDLATACLILMERYNYEEIGEFLNVGAGEDRRIKDLALL
ncbi:MAG TPA: NAD-dependent epimerase/dehydratase family protein, partial [Syntrophorhabdales bacterium]|nr:NAD-dependent epimerase/dehydratase family protein [Syntrophorhabdales bacterium]